MRRDRAPRLPYPRGVLIGAGVAVLAVLAIVGWLAFFGGASTPRRAMRKPPSTAGRAPQSPPASSEITGSEESSQAWLPGLPQRDSIKSAGPGPAIGVTDVIALQPSHQDDTGEGWHEYLITGDIADAAIAALPPGRAVKAWDISDGLTGSNNYRPTPSNTRAFDKELAVANRARARYFVAIHNDAGAPSGVLGEYMPSDSKGRAFTTWLVDELSADIGLPNRGTRAVRLYSLEPGRNGAEYRALLEIGDNVADRSFLSSAANRKRIGRALAGLIVSFAKKQTPR